MIPNDTEHIDLIGIAALSACSIHLPDHGSIVILHLGCEIAQFVDSALCLTGQVVIETHISPQGLYRIAGIFSAHLQEARLFIEIERYVRRYALFAAGRALF